MIAGGLFAVSRDWFLSIGAYDADMVRCLECLQYLTNRHCCHHSDELHCLIHVASQDIWGGENFGSLLCDGISHWF